MIIDESKVGGREGAVQSTFVGRGSKEHRA